MRQTLFSIRNRIVIFQRHLSKYNTFLILDSSWSQGRQANIARPEVAVLFLEVFLLISAELFTVLLGYCKCSTESCFYLSSKYAFRIIIDFFSTVSIYSICANWTELRETGSLFCTLLSYVIIHQMKTYADFWLSTEKLYKLFFCITEQEVVL